MSYFAPSLFAIVAVVAVVCYTRVVLSTKNALGELIWVAVIALIGAYCTVPNVKPLVSIEVAK